MTNNDKTILLTSIIAMTILLGFSAQDVYATPGDFIVTEFGDDVNEGKLLRISADGSQETIASGLNFPIGVVTDSNGDFIVTEFESNDNAGDGNLLRISADGSQETIASGLLEPVGVAIDSDGDFIVTDRFDQSLLRILPDGVKEIIYQPFEGGPHGVAIDSDGDFIVTDTFGVNPLLRISPDGTSVETIASGLNFPVGVAIDSNGDFIVTEAGVEDGEGNLLRISPDGTSVETIASGLDVPVGVAIDSNGDFIVTEGRNIANEGNLLRISPDGTSVETIASGLNFPVGITIEPVTKSTFDGLIEKIESMELHKGTENSLISKVNSASNSFENGNNSAAKNKLNAFINQVSAQDGKKLTGDEADLLRECAQAIIDNI